MKIQVSYLKSALAPMAKRVEEVDCTCLQEIAPGWDIPYLAFVDGRPVLRKDWNEPLKEGQSVSFVDVDAMPQGGGGGGSNPLKVVLTLAVSYYTLGAGAGWAAALDLGAAGTFAVKAGAYLVGSALVNALIPAPKAPSPIQTAALAAPSPTYSLQAQGNAARLEAAIPEHFGRMIAYPDFAAQPYQEFAGNEQYLYQLLCVGRGEYEIEQIRIEDTSIAAFDEIEYEIVPPGGSLTLFPANVTSSVEVAGQDLFCRSASYTQSGTTITVGLISHGLSIGKSVYLNVGSGSAASATYTVTGSSGPDSFEVTSSVSASTSGSVTVSPWVGGFNANASGSVANYVGVDYVLARGLYFANDNGSLSELTLSVAAEARTIDAAGSPTGAWFTLGVESITGATTTPQRLSKRYPVSSARYQVRVRRVDVEQTDSRYGHHVQWVGLRAYLPDSRNYGDVTLLAMRLRASNNLTLQASRKINVICTRKLPIWNGSTFSAKVATRSIAWAIVYACKQVGLSNAQIDLEGLRQLDQTWSTRGDTFDGRFDAFLSFWEAVTKIAAVGRAKPFMQGGVFRVMRDQPQTVPVALFSVRNIVQGSFSINYLMPTADTADAVDVSYLDSGTWTPTKVRAKLPGSTAAKPSKVDLFGVVNRDQAFREGMRIAAENRYRRKIIKFTTEMEGFIPSFGDLIALQHDLPAWGQGGDVVAYDAATKTLTLSEPVTFGAGQNYIALRKRDGSLDGPYAATVGPTPYKVVIDRSPTIVLDFAGNRERTHFVFGAGDGYRQLAILLSAKPTGLNQVEIEAVNEDPNVHTAEIGLVTPAPQTSGLANYTNAPVIRGLMARSMPNAPEKMLLTWEPSSWADSYLIEQSSDGQKWTRCGETTASNFTAIALYGNATLLRVAAVGLARGPWVQIAFGDNADYMWSSNEGDLMWNPVDSTLMWRY